MRRTLLRTVAVAAWLLALSPIPSTLGQDTEEVILDRYGWWNANQTLPADPTGGLLPTLEVPPPPGAPEDGLYIESGANDTALAIAAVNYYTGGGVDAVLTLDVAGDGGADGATLAACPADGGWDAAQNGRWDKRPLYDPAGCTYLGSVSGSTISFTIPAAAHAPGSAFLTLAIVPAAGSGAFSVGFEAPSSGGLTTSSPSSSPSGEPASEPVTSGPVYDPGSATVGDTSFTPPASDPVELPTAAPVASGSEEMAAPPTTIVAGPPLVAEDVDRAQQLLAVAGLVLIGGALWWLSSQPQRAPRLLGSLAVEGAPAQAVAVSTGGSPRGLGRFARSRSVPPTPI